MNVTFCEKRYNCTRIMLIKTPVTCYDLDGPEFKPRRGNEIFFILLPLSRTALVPPLQ